MVDVGNKAETHRIAIVTGKISMLQTTLNLIQQGNAKKGDVLGIARIAAIQASKKIKIFGRQQVKVQRTSLRAQAHKRRSACR